MLPGAWCASANTKTGRMYENFRADTPSIQVNILDESCYKYIPASVGRFVRFPARRVSLFTDEGTET